MNREPITLRNSLMRARLQDQKSMFDVIIARVSTAHLIKNYAF